MTNIEEWINGYKKKKISICDDKAFRKNNNLFHLQINIISNNIINKY